jgi:hypothetical protein
VEKTAGTKWRRVSMFGPWFGGQVRVLNWQEQHGAPTRDARLTQK